MKSHRSADRHEAVDVSCDLSRKQVFLLLSRSMVPVDAAFVLPDVDLLAFVCVAHGSIEPDALLVDQRSSLSMHDFQENRVFVVSASVEGELDDQASDEDDRIACVAHDVMLRLAIELPLNIIDNAAHDLLSLVFRRIFLEHSFDPPSGFTSLCLLHRTLRSSLLG